MEKPNRPDRQANVERSERPTRTLIGMRNRLSFRDRDPNYVYRLVSDIEDRLSRFEEAGYEYVTGNGKVGDTRVADPSKMGSRITKSVGNGVTGVLMRIKKEWYDEDQKAKVAQVNTLEQSMKPKTESDIRNGYGLTDG